MDNALMTYNYNTEMQSEKRDTTLAAVIAVIVGLLSVLAASVNITGEAANMLPMLAATATPGIFVWVLSYLAANAEMEENEPEGVLCNG